MAREGVPFIGMAALATVVLAVLQMPWPAAAAFAATAFCLYFFRDPERIVPHGPDLIVSPADGKVIQVAEGEEDPYFGPGRRLRISIFMNVFDCHVNRSPIAGRVVDMAYFQGRFMPADRARAMAENERCAMLLEDDKGRRITVVQVAGLIARRIVCLAQVGDGLERGQRYGMIRFGSRLDLYLPAGSNAAVRPGDRVTAGQSTIARFC